MTPDELRDGARALYLRFAEQLQLKPWRPGGWRMEPPSHKQITALGHAARTPPEGLTADEERLLREVALDYQRAGRGAAFDIIAVTCAMRGMSKARKAPAVHAQLPTNDNALRVELARRVLSAPRDVLDRLQRALDGAT